MLDPAAIRLVPTTTLLATLLSLGIAAGSTGEARAAELEPPTGRVVLRITGAIEARNDGDAAAFDLAQLEALAQTTVRTETPWTDGMVEFRGPLARTVLAAAGARGERVRATAINDYTVAIPVTDLESYSVIFALSMDGKRMRVRDRGPIWVIYPWSDHAELNTDVYHGRAIWQLRSLVVE